MLWPQDGPPIPDAVVASLVSRLRRVLGPDASSAAGTATASATSRPTSTAPGRCSTTPTRAAAGPRGGRGPQRRRLLEAGEALAEEADADWIARRARRGRRPPAAGPARSWPAAALDDGDAADRRGGRPARAGRRPARRGGRARCCCGRCWPAASRPRRCASTSGCAAPSPTSSAPTPRPRPGGCTRRRSRGEPPARPERLAATAGRPARPRRAATPSSAGCARHWEQACGHRAGVRAAGRGAGHRQEPPAGGARRARPAHPAARCCAGAPSRGSARSSPSRWSTRWRPRSEHLPAEAIRRARGRGPRILGRLVPGAGPVQPTPCRRAAGAPPPSSGRRASPPSPSFLRGPGPRAARCWSPWTTCSAPAGRPSSCCTTWPATSAGEQVLLAAAARTGEGDDVVDLLRGVGTTVPLGPLPAGRRRRSRRARRARGAAAARRHAAHRRPPAVRRRGAARRSPAGDDRPARRRCRPRWSTGSPRTGEETERLLRAAAVLGAAFDPVVAGELAGTPATAALPAFERAFTARLLVVARAGCTSSRTTSSGRPCSPRRRRRRCWPGTPGPPTCSRPIPRRSPGTRRRSATGRGRRAPGCTPRSAALARFVGQRRDRARHAGGCAIAGELDDAELRGRALVVRGRANDAAAALRRGARRLHRSPGRPPAGPATGGWR